MRARFATPLLLLLGGLLVGWLLLTEIEGAGLLGSAPTRAASPVPPPGSEAALAADLERRARLRGLPGLETAPVGTGRLVGRLERHVADEGARPVAGAPVEVYGLEGATSVHETATTGDDGRFEFTGLPALVGYALLVRHPPWRDVVLRGITVRRDRSVDLGTIRLGAPTLLRGIVLDGAGRAVGRAEVQVFSDRSRPGRIDLRGGLRDLLAAGEPLAQGWSEGDGAFQVADLPPGRYVVKVGAPGFATAFRDDVWVTADERAPALRIVLDPGAGWTGRVLDESSRAVADARVIAIAVLGKRTTSLDRVESTTDVDGHYRLDSLVPGVSYLVEAWAPGYAPAARILTPTTLGALDLVLRPSGRVEGTISDAATGEGIPGAEVVLVAGTAEALSPLSTVTGPDGRYVFEHVGPGPVAFFNAKAPGHPWTWFTFGADHAHRVEAGSTTVVDLALPSGITAQGRVLDRRGAPVAWATVSFADPRRPGEAEETALAGADGAWQVTGLRETTYEVHVEATGYAPLVTDEQARVEVRAPGPVRTDLLVDRGATLDGMVRDPEGAAVGGARVEVVAAGGGSAARRVRDLVAVTGAGGAWRIGGVPPNADVVVEARHDAWASSRSASLRLAPGAAARVDLVLGAGLAIEGRVEGPDGRPVPGARVRWGRVGPEDERQVKDAFRADQLLLPRVVRTDEEGRFRIERLEPGRHVVKVEHEGHAAWYRHDVMVADAPAPLAVRLTPAATIEGRVTDAQDGAPVAGAWVYARAERDTPDGEPPPDPGVVAPLVSTATGSDGRFRLEPVPPGRFEVVVWLAPGYRADVDARGEETFRRRGVVPGRTDLTFALPRQ